MDAVVLFIIGFLAIVNWCIYHKLFDVYYFNLGMSLVVEIIMSCLAAIIEVAILLTLFASGGALIGGLLSGIIGVLGTIVGFVFWIVVAVLAVVIIRTLIKKILSLVSSGKATSPEVDYPCEEQFDSQTVSAQRWQTASDSQSEKARDRFCMHCGKEALPGNRFCMYCGKEIRFY